MSSAEALIAHLRLAIEKMRRELYGQRSERKARLLDQMELQLEELEAAAAEDELAAATASAAAGETPVRPHIRRTPSRKPFPAHLPRERIVVPGPTTCTCCGSGRLAKLGEDVTETLESVPRRWKVVQIVREKFTCRDCETISQAPVPFHVLPRGFAGPSLLVADLEIWMRAERVRLSRHSDVAKAMDYMLKRRAAFTRFLDDGRFCLANNAAERALCGIALGRKSWLFAGSDRGGERAALMYTLIQTARLNDVDPQAWLADVLARINDHAIRDLAALLPWNWTPAPTSLAA